METTTTHFPFSFFYSETMNYENRNGFHNYAVKKAKATFQGRKDGGKMGKLKRLKSPEELESLRREIHDDLLKYDPTRRRIEMLENENFQLRILVKELKKSLVKANPSMRTLDLEEEEKDFSFIYKTDDSLRGMLS